MKPTWIKTAHTGLRYWQHPTRKHGKRYDRYYSIRFKVDGKDYEYGIGWQSEGVPEEVQKDHPNIGFEEYCLMLLRQYKGNVKSGAGAMSPKEKRKKEEEQRLEEEATQEELMRDAVTFDSFFADTYLPQAEATKKPRTVVREKQLYNVWIKKAIGAYPLKDVVAFHLEKLKKTMVDGKQSPRSAEYALAIVRQVFNVAKKHKVFRGENPVADVTPVKVDNGRMRFLTNDEATALLEALKNRSPDVYGMTLLSLHAGLRFGEIAALTLADVDLDKKVLTIRDAKAGSRYAFLTTQAADMLRERLHGTPSDYVFPGRKGKKIDRISMTFFRTVDDLKLNQGIADPRLQVCFHTCRHSYASWLIEEGADLYTVQRLLGHKTNVMTQRYAHLSESRLKAAVAALEASWKAKEERKDNVVTMRKE